MKHSPPPSLALLQTAMRTIGLGGATMTGHQQDPFRERMRSHPCAHCNAKAGERCHSKGGHPCEEHAARFYAVKEQEQAER